MGGHRIFAAGGVGMNSATKRRLWLMFAGLLISPLSLFWRPAYIISVALFILGFIAMLRGRGMRAMGEE